MRRKLLKGGLVLSAGVVISRGCAMLSSIQVAWMLPEEQFGIGASLWLIAVFLKMLSDLGVDRLIVQAEDGDDEHLGRVAQTMMLLRGVFLGSMMFVLAYPTALLIHRPDVTWAFQLVALQALVDGCMHRDVVRLQRQFRFLPTSCVVIIPNLAAMLLAYPLAAYFGDFRVFLALAFIRSLLAVGASFFFADHAYRLAWDGPLVRRFVEFGWPLLINGIFIYAGVQGLQLIVAHCFPMEAMAAFSIAVMLTWMPVSEVDCIVQRLALPTLASARVDRALFLDRVSRLASTTGLVAAGVFTFYALLAPYIIRVYGPKYADAAILVALLGVGQSMRLLRTSTSVTAVSLGFTRLVAVSNSTRLLNLLVCYLLAQDGYGLTTLCVATILADSFAFPLAVALLHHKERIDYSTFLPGASIFLATASIVAVSHWQLQLADNPLWAFSLSTVLLLALGVFAYASLWKVSPETPSAEPAA